MLHRVDTSSSTVATPQGVMRLLSLAAGAFIFAFEAAPVQAQEWNQYLAFDDYFSIDFPSQPTIREITYTTEYGLTLPARVYTGEDDFGTYSAIAVDWREAEALQQEIYEACQVRTGDRGGGDNPGLCSRLQAGIEIRGATKHAAFGFLQRGSEVTHFGYAHNERVEGTGIQLLNEDGSRSFVSIYWHEYFLYITEATTPQGMPPPILFSTSLSFLDEDGLRVAYVDKYSPLFPVPTRRR